MSNTQADRLAEKIKLHLHASLMSPMLETETAALVDQLAALAKQQASPPGLGHLIATLEELEKNGVLPWEATEALEAFNEETQPLSTTPAGAVLTDEQIKELAHLASKAGFLSWLGYEKDDAGFYTVPSLAPCHYQLARVIEAEVRSSLYQVREQAALPVEPTEDMLALLNPHLTHTPYSRYKALRAALAQGTTPAAGVGGREQFIAACMKIANDMRNHDMVRVGASKCATAIENMPEELGPNESIEYEVVQDGCAQFASPSLAECNGWAQANCPWTISIYRTRRTLISQGGKVIAPQAAGVGEQATGGEVVAVVSTAGDMGGTVLWATDNGQPVGTELYASPKTKQAQAEPMSPECLADYCEAWLQAGGASNVVDAYEAGARQAEKHHAILAEAGIKEKT